MVAPSISGSSSQTPRIVTFVLGLTIFAVTFAACSSSSTDESLEAGDPTTTTSEEGEQTAETAETETSETETNDSSTDAATPESLDAYLAEAALIELPNADNAVPEGVDRVPGGAPGYTRYVFRDNGSEVIPTMVEGPTGPQTRCQEVDLPCSRLELKELLESGDPIPEELDLTTDELEDLVDELDAVNDVIERYPDPSKACADGFISDRIQSANMGTHFIKMDNILDGTFDPSNPEILLYSRADGVVPDGPVGECQGGEWVGPEMNIVGSSFLIWGAADTHPEGFSGNLDNWHIHLNLCRGNSAGRDAFVPENECREGGGDFFPALGWMIHAWAEDVHDNQLGTFAMWNPAIAPVSDVEEVASNRVVAPDDLPEDASVNPVTNFNFGDVEVGVGDTVVWSNADSVPHTVTAGTANEIASDFDSGVFSPGENFEWQPEEAGEFSFFCALHPDMVAKVTVTE